MFKYEIGTLFFKNTDVLYVHTYLGSERGCLAGGGDHVIGGHQAGRWHQAGGGEHLATEEGHMASKGGRMAKGGHHAGGGGHLLASREGHLDHCGHLDRERRATRRRVHPASLCTRAILAREFRRAKIAISNKN